MAFWDGLLGGSGDVGLYDELLTDKQRSAIRDPFSSRSLAAMAKAFADAAKPSLLPGPGLGATIGNAAYAMTAGQDEAAQALLKAGLTAQQVAALKRQAALQEKVSPYLLKILENLGVSGAGGTTSPIVPPAAAAPRAPVAPASFAPPPVAQPPSPPGAVPGLPPGAQTGLLGGDTQMAGLSPPDEYIPPGGQSILDIIQASYGGGAGIPGSPFRDGADAAPTLRLASASRELNDIPGGAPFPTIARPDAEPNAWERGLQYNWPPASAARDVIGPTPLGGSARGVPEGRQRDPGEPGLPAADRRALPQPATGSSPLSSVAALADAIKSGDVVLPSGRGVPPSMLQLAQARTGGASGGAAGPFMPPLPDPRILSPGTGGGIGDPIPGLGASPKELMAIDALAEMAKMGSPLKGLLESYYKTPGYLEQAAGAAKRGALPGELFLQQFGQRTEYGYKLLQDLAKDNMTLDAQGNIVMMPESQRIRTMNADEIARVQEEWKAKFQPVEVDVIGPDGKTIIKQKMTQWELQQREEAARRRGAGGMTGAPQPGDIAGTRQYDPEQLEGQKLDYKILDEKRVLATAASSDIRKQMDMRQSIQSGVIAGAGADVKLQILKLGQLLGLTGKDANDLIANTERYVKEQADGLKESLKGLGPPVSNVDVQIAQQLGGSQKTTVQGMLKILEIREKHQKLALREYNQMVPKAAQSRFISVLPEPAPPGATIADGPNGTSIWYDTASKQWIPAL